MSLKKQKRDEITQFVLSNIRDHPSDIVRFSQAQFGLSRTAILRYIHNLTSENLIYIQGTTKNIKYLLRPLHTLSRTYKLEDTLAEDTVWRNDVLPLFVNTKENALNICQYGFTEIFNNSIEHSEGKEVKIVVTAWVDKITIEIADDGVGIFNKIQQKYKLDDPLHAILELSKGKLTTEPASHTGEGIFFTSRMFDSFMIVSGNLCFGSRTWDWFFESGEHVKGTVVCMEISPNTDRTTKSVFDNFISSPEEYGFDKTVVPVELASYGKEKLVSRSQAKRLLTRLEKFKVVVLDFKNIDIIGRAFTDEIFRVFANKHPNTTLLTINENDAIRQLVREVQSGRIQ
jgi:anti-sigma regulatory factor (Ser/Thr protein kinase)